MLRSFSVVALKNRLGRPTWPTFRPAACRRFARLRYCCSWFRLDFVRRVAHRAQDCKTWPEHQRAHSNAPKLHANEKPALGATVMADRCRLPIRRGGACKPHWHGPSRLAPLFTFLFFCKAGD